MTDTLEVQLARAEAVKRLRAAVRLELSLAGDRVIAVKVKQIKSEMDRLLSSGGLPALENSMQPWARSIADKLLGALENSFPELPSADS